MQAGLVVNLTGWSSLRTRPKTTKDASSRPEPCGFIARRSGETPAFRFCRCLFSYNQVTDVQLLRSFLSSWTDPQHLSKNYKKMRHLYRSHTKAPSSLPKPYKNPVISTGAVRFYRTAEWRDPHFAFAVACLLIRSRTCSSYTVS